MEINECMFSKNAANFRDLFSWKRSPLKDPSQNYSFQNRTGDPSQISSSQNRALHKTFHQIILQKILS